MGMPRIALAALCAAIVAMSVTTAAAGQKCVKRPDYVLVTPNAQLDERGQWHRRVGDADEIMKSGHVSQTAVARVEKLVSAGSTDQAVHCLDALIVNEKSAAAAKACKVAKR